MMYIALVMTRKVIDSKDTILGVSHIVSNQNLQYLRGASFFMILNEPIKLKTWVDFRKKPNKTHYEFETYYYLQTEIYCLCLNPDDYDELQWLETTCIGLNKQLYKIDTMAGLKHLLTKIP